MKLQRQQPENCVTRIKILFIVHPADTPRSQKAQFSNSQGKQLLKKPVRRMVLSFVNEPGKIRSNHKGFDLRRILTLSLKCEAHVFNRI